MSKLNFSSDQVNQVIESARSEREQSIEKLRTLFIEATDIQPLMYRARQRAIDANAKLNSARARLANATRMFRSNPSRQHGLALDEKLRNRDRKLRTNALAQYRLIQLSKLDPSDLIKYDLAVAVDELDNYPHARAWKVSGSSLVVYFHTVHIARGRSVYEIGDFDIRWSFDRRSAVTQALRTTRTMDHPHPDWDFSRMCYGTGEPELEAFFANIQYHAALDMAWKMLTAGRLWSHSTLSHWRQIQ